MKKLLKFIFYFILFILLVLMVAPVIFKGKIVDIANEQINNNIEAKGGFDDIKLSFFRQFPYLSINLQELCIEGIDEFEGDTLAYIKSFDIAVDIISAIKMENIEVKRLVITEPKINALILESGMANWDIAKESETVEEEIPDTSASSFDANIALKLFRIKDAQINYTDNESGMAATINDFNFDLSGDFSQSLSSLKIISSSPKLNFMLDGIRYLSDVALDIDMNIDADLDNMLFTIKENSFGLNNFILTLNGDIHMPEEEDIMVNMTYKTNNADFKNLLSLIPVIYLNDFEGLQTAGNMMLEGTIKGPVNDVATPDVKGSLKVSKAMFSYPDLPEKANNINILVDYFYDGRQMDNTTVDVNQFHIEMGINPIDFTLNLKTPISDPFINCKLTANIDLASILNIVPLDDTELSGTISSNLDLMGNLSLIENEEYESFKADGSVNIENLVYNSPDVPDEFRINSAQLNFSPKFVDLQRFSAKMGESDFSMSGKVFDFLPYVFNDETIRGELSLNAGFINLDALMIESEEVEVVEEDTASAALTAIEIPANIDFALNSKIDKVLVNEMELTNVIGMIYLRDSRAVLEKVKLNAFDGSLELSGEYNTQNIKNPLVDFNVQATSIDIPQVFSSFGVLKKIAPIASKATGNVSMGFEISSFLTDNMKPVLKSIISNGNLSSNKIGINGGTMFNAIGSKLNSDAFKELVLNNINLNYEVRSGKLFVEPFETSMGSTNFLMSGEQGFDNSLDYGINISAPRSLFGTSNTTINGLYDNAAAKGLNITPSETINMLVNLSGQMSNPDVKINLKDNLKTSTSAITNELKTNARQELETKKAQARAEAKAKADKILKDAEVQANKIRQQGKVAADKIRAEADANAKRLIKEAKNPIAKKAAEVAAKKLRDEGDRRAKQVEAEANSRADKLMQEARNKANQLLK